jgi:hypothetical protein
MVAVVRYRRVLLPTRRGRLDYTRYAQRRPIGDGGKQYKSSCILDYYICTDPCRCVYAHRLCVLCLID